VSDEADLIVEKAGNVCTLTINRPDKHNVLTNECLERMTGVLGDLEKDDTVRVVVIRGAGERAFSAGYDIAALPVRPSVGAEGALKEKSPLEGALCAIRDYPYPVIAMVRGLTLGGGCELAVACDLRIASEDVRMGMPPARLGLVYPYDGLRRFMSVLGLSRTLEVFLTARRYEAADCLRLGLVNEVVESGRIEEVTYSLAEEIAGHAPLSLKGTKSALYAIARYPILDPAEEEAIRSLFIGSLHSEDMAEAREAFLEKRKPRFKGR